MFKLFYFKKLLISGLLVMLFGFKLFGTPYGISNSYFSGIINCENSISGGIASANSALISSTFWDTDVSGKNSSIGGLGKTTQELTDISYIDNIYVNVGWDFIWESQNGTQGIWNYRNGYNNSYPFLSWEYVDLPFIIADFSTSYTSGIVSLSWISLSENEIAGYHIYRNSNDNLTEAIRITQNIIPAYNANDVQSYTFSDQNTDESTGYYYWIQIVDMIGNVEYYGYVYIYTGNTSVNEDIVVSLNRTYLANVYPNPLKISSYANFEVSVKESEKANLRIFNIKGQLVKEFHDLNPGIHNIVWDGKSTNNKYCASGVYFYKLSSPKTKIVKKMLIIN